ncbi:hypothetical protein wVul_0246 [Wolbachia endosymbiont of Armadillidium vulgare str. wVulC]|nr:hypothetical protein wVul_0246 [Wolbachia endosymbiont of Armadillidium vulgare str. wVulC]
MCSDMYKIKSYNRFLALPPVIPVLDTGSFFGFQRHALE